MAAAEVVVVTGASAGIGRATAVQFARSGARVALLARGAAGLEAASREVEAAGGTALPIATDVADPAQVEAAAEKVERTWGGIDIWVNSAMATVFSPVSQLSAEEVRRATEVTYLGTVYGTMAALERMRRSGRGCIVQVGSALAYRAIPLQAPYCGAKFAIRGFTDALRSELLHEDSPIRITMVQLSAFNTPQFQWARTHIPRQPQPLPPVFRPELAARAIVWAAGHRRREVWVGGPAVKTILGNRLFPALLDRYLAGKGYSGQMTQDAIDPQRPDNLFAPLPGDFGSHGPFEAKARSSSYQLWATTHRGILIGVAITVLALAAVPLIS